MLCTHNTTENEILSAYYMPVGKDLEAGWKSFNLSNIVKVELTEERFQIANNYHSNDKRMKSIICCVDKPD